MKPDQQNGQWNQIVARAWQDEAFKQRLLAEPAAVLQKYGLQVPAGIKVKVVEDTTEVFHVTLPRKPAAEVSEQDLALVAGGVRVADDPCAGGQVRTR
jgi:hypothetical protein